MALVSINPATGEEIQAYPEHSSAEVQDILDQAIKAQKKWSALELGFRLECLEQISGTLRDRKREYAVLMAQEMGKPVAQAEAEVEKCGRPAIPQILCTFSRSCGRKLHHPIGNG